MKKVKLLIVVGLLLAFTVSFAQANDHVLKKDVIENVGQIGVESKEAYKVDDAEYTGCVISKSNIGHGLGFGSEGIALLGGIAMLVGLFKRDPLLTSLVLAAAIAFIINGDHSTSATVLAVAPFAIKINKKGLEGEALKVIEDLEKRFEAIDFKGLDESEVIQLQAKAIDAAFEPYKKIKELPFDKLIELFDKDKGVQAILLKQADEINKLKAGNIVKSMSVRDQVEAWQTKNKDVIAKIKGGTVAELPAFEIKAANSPMTPANTETSTVTLNAGSVLRMGGDFFDILRTQPTFWDYLTKTKTGLETYPWVDKKVPAASGAAAFIGPGIAKPGVSFTLDVEKSNAKKIAVSMKMATELLDDVDGMAGFVETELAYQLKIQLNADLMTGVLSSTKVAGVQTYSLTFTTSGLSTVNPNNWDCARALVAQMRLAFIPGNIVIFMNAVDTANMDMEKAVSQGTYMGLTVRQVPGAVIVEDLNIPAGYVQAVAIDCLYTKIYKGFMLKWGWENDDFTKNLVTAIAEMRLHSFHSSNHAAGFIYDTLANIKAQIAAA